LASLLLLDPATLTPSWPEILIGVLVGAASAAWLGAWTARHTDEGLEGAALAAESEVIGFDAKRLLVRHRLLHADEGWQAAENETLFLCVDLARRKVRRRKNLPADQRVRRVMNRDLRAGPQLPVAKVDRQAVGRFPRLRKLFRLDDGADPDLDILKVFNRS
jgi:hypothetical protein